MSRRELRQTAVELRRDYGHLLALPRAKGTEGQQRADALERARERVIGRRRQIDSQLRLDLR